MNAPGIVQDEPTKQLLPLPDNDAVLITRADLPRYLPIAKQSLARWACEGSGPRYIRIGGRIVAYRVGDIKAWLKEQERVNTVDVGGRS
jgi:predicted DNA-binding transcriptional regulator AlpA